MINQEMGVLLTSQRLLIIRINHKGHQVRNGDKQIQVKIETNTNTNKTNTNQVRNGDMDGRLQGRPSDAER